MNRTGSIALLTPYRSSEHLGGVEVVNLYLERALGDIEVFADPKGPPTASNAQPFRFGLDRPMNALRVAWAFLRSHRSRPFRLVICNGMCGWPLSLTSLDIPMIVVYHFTFAEIALRAYPSRADRFFMGSVMGFFDGLAGRKKQVVTVSESVLREVGLHYGLKGRVILNPVDTAVFRKRDKAAARKALGLPSDARIGLYVGRQTEAKGFDVVQETAKAMPDILFLAIAPGPAKAPNLRVVEQVAHIDTAPYYAASDFLLFPSRYEGCGMAVLEAAACGTPVVVSEAACPFSGDPARFGFVVRGFRPGDYVEGIRQVLARPSSYRPEEMIAGRHSFDVYQRAWKELVESALGRSKGP